MDLKLVSDLKIGASINIFIKSKRNTNYEDLMATKTKTSESPYNRIDAVVCVKSFNHIICRA